jgi:hypothetical protein
MSILWGFLRHGAHRAKRRTKKQGEVASTLEQVKASRAETNKTPYLVIPEVF